MTKRKRFLGIQFPSLKKRYIKAFILLPALALTASVSLMNCKSDHNDSDNGLPPLDPTLVQEGQQVFRYETFGDEVQWTDNLHMNEVIQAAVDPTTALSVGLKVDADALPADVVSAIQAGQVDLTDPQTTLLLIKLNAVVGIKGDVVQQADGSLALNSVGITCALCHSTVDNSFAPGIGKRQDGWPNRDLNPGAIIALSPVWDASTKALLNSWGPGKYDPRFNFDGKSNPVVIPPAYGLYGLKLAIFTGDGDVQHEPAGPVAYWNRYVAVTQMGGVGTFSDPRLPWDVDHTNGGQLPDRVTSKLPALQAYQWSIAAPAPNPGSFDFAAAERGKALFMGQAQCSSCHSGPSFSDAMEGKLHPQSASVAVDKEYVKRSATKKWRTTPLKGIWQHPPYFHDGSAATLKDVVERYNSQLGLNLDDNQKHDLTEYLKSL